MYIPMFIILFFFIGAMLLSIRAKKGKDMNMEQWAVGGREFGTVFVFLLMAGEAYSTFTLLGASGWAYSKGGPIYYFLAYTALAYVISYWLLPPLWRYANKHKLVSQSEFFAYKYQSPILGALVSLVGSLAMFAMLIIQFKGLGIIVSETSFGLISPTLAICVSVIALTVYVLVSGIHGSAWTAAVKDILIFIVLLFLGVYLPFHYYGGIQPMFEALNTQRPNFVILPEHGLSISWFISTTLLTGLGFYMWPYIFTASFSAKGPKALRKNSIIMPLYTLMFVFVYLVGFTAILQVPGLQGADGDLALLRLSTKTFDPWFIGIIGGVGLLSTLVLGSLLLMNISTTLAKNIYPLIVRNAREERKNKMAKYLVPVISLICLVYALGDNSSLNVFFLAGYSLVTQLFPSFLASLFKNNFITKQGAIVGICFGVGISIYTTLTHTTMATLFPTLSPVIQDLNVGVIAFLINIISMILVSIVTRSSINMMNEEKIS